MPISYEWYDEDAGVMLITAVGQWTGESFFTMLQETQEMARQRGGDFVAIADFSRSDSSVTQVVTQGHRFPDNHIEPLRRIVYAPGRLMNTVLKIFSRLFPNLRQSIVAVDSLEDAIAVAYDALEKEAARKRA